MLTLLFKLENPTIFIDVRLAVLAPGILLSRRSPLMPILLLKYMLELKRTSALTSRPYCGVEVWMPTLENEYTDPLRLLDHP